MNKEKFLNYFSTEEKDVAAKIYDSISTAFEYETMVIADEFFTPNICFKVQRICKAMGLEYFKDGFFLNSERSMMAFSKYELSYELEYPYEVLEIRNNSKFKNLEHKHYLGTIMSLGIKREKIGDLVINDNVCIVPVAKEISDYIRMNLEKINGCSVKVSILNDNDAERYKLSIKMIEKTILTSSMRLDAIVGSIANISRGKAEKLISSGKVKLDYVDVDKKNLIVKEESTLTIRGFGKFLVRGIIGETRKERLRVNISKFDN